MPSSPRSLPLHDALLWVALRDDAWIKEVRTTRWTLLPPLPHEAVPAVDEIVENDDRAHDQPMRLLLEAIAEGRVGVTGVPMRSGVREPISSEQWRGLEPIPYSPTLTVFCPRTGEAWTEVRFTNADLRAAFPPSLEAGAFAVPEPAEDPLCPRVLRLTDLEDELMLELMAQVDSARASDVAKALVKRIEGDLAAADQGRVNNARSLMAQAGFKAADLRTLRRKPA